jgi:pimeloyl-ACP methyl ester carboxylesterase
MPGSDPLTHALAVPGARLYYERRGTGPLLLLIGSPMDSAGLAGLAAAMAGDYTVVTYDPRGIGNSSCQDPGQDVTPEQQADDVHRLLSALGGEPAYVFGSSGGAVVGLALVTAHPGQVRRLVAHEPPVVELLSDSAQLRDQIQDIYDTYRAEGADQAMGKFMAHAGLGGTPGQEADAPRWEPSPEQMARMRATTDVFLAHLIRPTTEFKPDIEALRAASTHIVVAAGATSKGQLAHRSTVALADQLGTPVVEFPGDHGGFVALPEQCGRVLRFSQQLSADHLVLELHQDEDGLCDVADRGRADHDVLQDAPALRHQGEAAFALVAQGA